MTELELYKFVQDKEIGWRGDKLILWIDHYSLPEFADLLGDNLLCDGGLEVTLLSGGTIALDIVDLCENHDIDPENILRKEANP